MPPVEKPCSRLAGGFFIPSLLLGREILLSPQRRSEKDALRTRREGRGKGSEGFQGGPHLMIVVFKESHGSSLVAKSHVELS